MIHIAFEHSKLLLNHYLHLLCHSIGIWMDETRKILDIVNKQFQNYVSQNEAYIKENFQYYSVQHKGIGTGENEIFNTIDELENAYLSTTDTSAMQMLNTETIQAKNQR